MHTGAFHISLACTELCVPGRVKLEVKVNCFIQAALIGTIRTFVAF